VLLEATICEVQFMDDAMRTELENVNFSAARSLMEGLEDALTLM